MVLEGEFDITNVDLLRARLEQVRRAEPRRLVFETARVTFMDCASARIVADTVRWLPADVKPVFRRPSPIVHRVLQVSGLASFCDLEPCG